MSDQIRNTGRYKRILANGLPFELTLESLSETAKYERAQDKERMKQFNSDVKAWTTRVTSLLKRNIRAMVRRDITLSESVHPNIYYDRKYVREVNRIGFGFLREGIYIHKGAGRGQGGYQGSQWTDKYGTLKSTNPASLGKMGKNNRRPLEWFNPVIEKELSALADIVAEYSADLQINATRIFISD
ncbi:hypothetical protein LJC11_03030 [Bacteroidales bacterium OttesenSCG-928-I21]|nr:hypothetical protein [Bacteroidales bacterium OttesenSCG-928-I21]